MASAVTAFDILVCLLLLGSIVAGYWTGIVTIFFIVLGLVGGVWAAHQYAASWEMHPVVVFSLVSVSVIVIGYIVHRFLSASMGFLNGLMGGFAGLLLGMVFVSMALLPVSRHVSSDHRKAVSGSWTMRRFAPMLEKRLPRLYYNVDIGKIREKLHLHQPVLIQALQKNLDFTLTVSTAQKRNAPPPAVETFPGKR